MDDLILSGGNDSFMLKGYKTSIIVEFEMSNLGMMHYLGIEVVQLQSTKYVQDILKKYSYKKIVNV